MDQWDPHRALSTPGLWEYLGNYIVNFDPNDGSPVPELAERWEFQDPQTLVLFIRKGVRFHDLAPVNGRELTAQDVVWNIQRMSRSGASYVWKSNFEPITTITAVDKSTVQIKLKYPFAPMVGYLKGVNIASQVILAPDVEEKLGEDGYKDLSNARATGPFLIKSWTPGVGGVLVRNPRYWQEGKPYLDSVVLSQVQDPATMLAAFRVGRADMGSGFGGAMDIVAKRGLERTNPSIKFSDVIASYVVVLVPNVAKKPFDDVRLRKAIFLAIDRQEILQVNAAGAGHIAGPMSWKLFPGWTWSYESLMQREGYRAKNTPDGQKDIAEAQRLMREMGYGPDKPLVIEAEGCYCPDYFQLTPTEVAKSQLQKIWIDIARIKIVDRSQWFDQDARGDFLLRSRVYAAPLDPDGQLYTRHHSLGGRNYQKLSDPELDRLIEEQRREPDVSKRKQLVLRAQERLWNLYPQVWLHVREDFRPQQSWVEVQPTIWRPWGDPASTWINR